MSGQEAVKKVRNIRVPLPAISVMALKGKKRGWEGKVWKRSDLSDLATKYEMRRGGEVY